MPDTFRDIHKIWALKEIVLSAADKCKILCEKDDIVSKQSMLSLMLIVSDATEKITNLRWTDADGLHYGVKTYLQAIDNL